MDIIPAPVEYVPQKLDLAETRRHPLNLTKINMLQSLGEVGITYEFNGFEETIQLYILL